MIHLSRAAEPPQLPATREERLAKARLAREDGRPIEFRDHDLVKPELADMQHNKCCYCEKREEQAKYRDVEHYRPKSTYWWLAWTWENLLFSCIDCNREHKRDQFPLLPDDQALLAEQLPPGEERPLIIDPSRDDPMPHIEFRRETVQKIERWRPYGLTDRGRTTIQACGLDRPGLIDLYKDHVNHTVRPKLAPFLSLLAQSEATQIVRAWSTVCRGLLGAERPFRALSHDAMKILVPQGALERYHLTLPRP